MLVRAAMINIVARNHLEGRKVWAKEVMLHHRVTHPLHSHKLHLDRLYHREDPWMAGDHHREHRLRSSCG